jgi:hypothetical protein
MVIYGMAITTLLICTIFYLHIMKGSFLLKRLVYYLLILIIVLSAPIQIFVWGKYIEPRWGLVEIITASSQIERGDIIHIDNLVQIFVKPELVVEQGINNITEIVGQESTRLIRKGEQVTSDMLNKDKLSPNINEVNMPLPIEWIMAMPGSLLRGDLVSLDPVKRSDNTEIKSVVDGIPVNSTTPEEVTITEYEWLLLQDIRVSYSRSSNNQEVTATDDRKKPTGSVTRFEVIVSMEQREIIKKYGKLGYKFIVTYR